MKNKKLFLIHVVAVVTIVHTVGLAATWTGSGSTPPRYWDNAGNWDTLTIPIGVDVFINSGGTGDPILRTLGNVLQLGISGGKTLTQQQEWTLTVSNGLGLSGGTNTDQTTYILTNNAALDVTGGNTVMGSGSGSYSFFSNSSGKGAHTHGSNGNLIIAEGSGSNSTYSLQGGASVTADNIFVGQGGEGEMRQSTGVVAVNSLIIGKNSGSTGLYEIFENASTRIDIALALVIGDLGEGTLNLPSSSFTINVPTIDIGKESGSVGTLNISQGTIQAPSGESLFVNVGEGGTGKIVYEGGAFQPFQLKVWGDDDEIDVLADWSLSGKLIMTGGKILVGDASTSATLTISKGSTIGPAAAGKTITIGINP